MTMMVSQTKPKSGMTSTQIAKERLMLFAGIRFGIGLLVVMGVAGSDCDGKCMENAMPMDQMLMWAALGIGLMISALPTLTRGSNEY